MEKTSVEYWNGKYLQYVEDDNLKNIYIFLYHLNLTSQNQSMIKFIDYFFINKYKIILFCLIYQIYF